MELGPMQNFVYLVGDPETRECVVVDPAWEIDTIVGTAEADGMTITDDRVDLPRRIDDDALAGLGITDEVDEVLHGPEFHLLEVDRLRVHALHRIPAADSALEWDATELSFTAG